MDPTRTTSDSSALILYLASPLFSIADRRWNRTLATAIEERLSGSSVILPQDFKLDDRYNDRRAFRRIFRDCVAAIDRSRAVIALLDGPDTDSGTALEMGYAVAKKIPVIGVRTDFRENQERGVNVMIVRSCAAYVQRSSFLEEPAGLADEIVAAVRATAMN